MSEELNNVGPSGDEAAKAVLRNNNVPISMFMAEPDQIRDGQVYFSFCVSDEIIAALSRISERLHDARLNFDTDYDGENPFVDSGSGFTCPVFSVQSSPVAEDSGLPQANFQWHDVMVNWYLSFPRSASVNREVEAWEVNNMLAECLRGIEVWAHGNP